MSPLKLDLTKSAAIDAAINTAEGKATTRTADSSTATALANFAETELTNLGLPKKYWKGAKATYLPGAVCGSYGYAAFGTASQRFEFSSKASSLLVWLSKPFR